MFGLSEMDKKGHAKDVSDADLEKLLGKSENGHWMAPEDAEVRMVIFRPLSYNQHGLLGERLAR